MPCAFMCSLRFARVYYLQPYVVSHAWCRVSWQLTQVTHDIVIAYNLFAFALAQLPLGIHLCKSVIVIHAMPSCWGHSRFENSKAAGSGPRSGSKNIRPPTVPTRASLGDQTCAALVPPSPATHILLHPLPEPSLPSLHVVVAVAAVSRSHVC